MPPANPPLGAGNTYDRIEDGVSHMYESADQDQGRMIGYELPRSSVERSPSPEVREGEREGGKGWGGEGGSEGGRVERGRAGRR